MIDWLEKLELIFKVHCVEDVASAIPLGLTFLVFLQLLEAERKFSEVKKALVAVFMVDPFLAYEQFSGE